MSLSAQKIHLLRARKFYPIGVDWSSLLLVNGTPDDIESAAATATQTALEEIASGGIMGLKMTTAGDIVSALKELPSDYDIAKKGYVSVVWASAAAAVGARDVTWKAQVGGITPGTNVVATSDATLTMAVQAPAGSAGTIEETTQQEIPADTFASTDELINWTVEMDAFDAAFTEDKFLLGAFLEYTRRWYPGSTPQAREGVAHTRGYN